MKTGPRRRHLLHRLGHGLPQCGVHEGVAVRHRAEALRAVRLRVLVDPRVAARGARPLAWEAARFRNGTSTAERPDAPFPLPRALIPPGILVRRTEVV